MVVVAGEKHILANMTERGFSAYIAGTIFSSTVADGRLVSYNDLIIFQLAGFLNFCVVI